MELNLDKNPDYQYCKQVLEQLSKLEKIRAQRFELKREFDKELDKKRSIYAIIIALILPLIVLIYFFVSEYGMASIRGGANNLVFTRTLGIFIICTFMFIGTYLFVCNLWDKKNFLDLKAKAQKALLEKYEDKKLEINKESQAILNSDLIKNSKIPQRYLSVNMITMLMRYFNKGHASFMDSAVAMLDMDIKKSSYIQRVANDEETLIEKETDYLKNYKPYAINFKL